MRKFIRKARRLLLLCRYLFKNPHLIKPIVVDENGMIPVIFYKLDIEGGRRVSREIAEEAEKQIAWFFKRKTVFYLGGGAKVIFAGRFPADKTDAVVRLEGDGEFDRASTLTMRFVCQKGDFWIK